MGRADTSLAPLGRRSLELVGGELGAHEQVLFVLVGGFGQAIVALDQRMLVVKPTVMAGGRLGEQVTSYRYADVIGVEVAGSQIEIHTAATGGQAFDLQYGQEVSRPNVLPLYRRGMRRRSRPTSGSSTS